MNRIKIYVKFIVTKQHQKSERARPLSPHLGIYKPQISSVLSIGHRISGVGLFVMSLFFTWYFICWVFNGFDESYGLIFDYGVVKLFLAITSYGFSYHLCTGIRHLFWDCGKGFSLCAVNMSGWFAVICSVLLTGVFWAIILN